MDTVIATSTVQYLQCWIPSGGQDGLQQKKKLSKKVGKSIAVKLMHWTKFSLIWFGEGLPVLFTSMASSTNSLKRHMERQI